MAEVSDAPLQRQLKVGRAAVGIIGLDVALNRVLADPELNEAAAAKQVFAEIREKNYIPPGMEEAYCEAIEKEVARLRAGRAARSGDLVIRILGPGCTACNNLQKVVLEAMARMGAAADIFQIHDPDEIGRFGVTRTPALVINGKIKSAGIHPSPAQVEEWLREALADP